MEYAFWLGASADAETGSRADASSPQAVSTKGFDPARGDAMPAEQMLGYWFKEYADLGHWFDKAHGKCLRCGTPTIDLYEDGSYGPVRTCRPSPSEWR